MIKIVWVNIKGEFGWKYTTQKTFKDILVSLKESFTHIKSQKVQGCFNQANHKLKYLHQKILEIDNDDEDKYRDKDIHESDNDGNNNINDDSGDGEANHWQQADQHQGEQLG